MTVRKPLTIVNGQVSQLPASDSLAVGNAALDPSQVNTAHTLLLPNKDGTLATLDDVAGAGGVPLSGNNAVALGTAAPGVGTAAAREDHVHPTTGLELTARKDQANGYAGLDAGGMLTAPVAYTNLRSVPGAVPLAHIDLANDALPSGAFVRSTSALYTGQDGYLHTAAPNEIRRDYDAATHEYLGALIEDPATNLAPHSNTCATPYPDANPGSGGWSVGAGAAWNGGTVTIVSSTRPSPKAGDNTAVEITIPAGDGYYYRLNHVPEAARGHWWSIYMLPISGEVNKLRLIADSTPSGTGVTYYTNEPKAVWNRWSRVNVFAPAVTTPTNDSLAFCIFNSSSSPITIRIWGLQFERNDVISSLIETTTTSAFRAADEITLTSAMVPGWTPTKGTAVIDYTPPPFSQYWSYHELMTVAHGSSAISRVRFGFQFDEQLRRYAFRAGSIVDGSITTDVTLGGMNPPSMSISARARIAGAWGGGRIGMAVNGRAESWESAIDTDIDRLKVMHLYDGASAVETGAGHGWLRSVTLYGDYLGEGELERLTALEVTPYIDKTAPALVVDGIEGTLEGFYFSRNSTAWRIGPWGSYEEVAANTPVVEWLLNVPQGTRIEGVGAENQFLWSDDLTNAAWTAYNQTASIEAGDHVIGSGWNKLDEGTVTAEHARYQTFTKPASATHATIWAIVREGQTCPDFALIMGPGSGFPVEMQVFFNATTHTKTGQYTPNANFVVNGTNIRQINAGAWLYSATIQLDPSVTTFTTGIAQAAPGGGTINYTGTNRTMLVGAMQLEYNRYPTSYVRSQATKGVRAPEMVWIKTADIPRWSNEEFTLLMEAAPCAIPHGTYHMMAHLSDGGVNNSYVEVQLSGDDPRLELYDGVNQLNLTDADSAKAGVQQWYAIQAKKGFAALVVDGRVTNGDWFYSYPPNLDRLRLGSRADYNTEDSIAYGGASFWLRYLEVHPRLLPRAELAQRTSRIADGRQERLSMGSNAPAVTSMATGTARNIWIDHTYYDQSFYNMYVVPKVRGPLTGNRTAQGIWVFSDVENPSNSAALFQYGMQATVRRANATDTSTNASNYMAGVIGVINHTTAIPTTAVTGTALSIQGTVNNASGTMTVAYGATLQNVSGGGVINSTTPINGFTTTQYGAFIRASANSGVGGTGNAYSYAGYVGTAYGAWVSNAPSTTGVNGAKGTIGAAYALYLEAQPSFATVRSTAVNTTFASSTTITRDSGSWLTDGFAVGNVISVFGSSAAGNNARHTITAVDATTITCAASNFTTVSAAANVFISVGGGIAGNKWALYQAGANDKSYFAGKLLINTTTDDGSGSNVQVSGGISINGLGVPTKHVTVFNATTDWGSAGDGYYTITVPATTHKAAAATVQVFESSGPDYDSIIPDRIRVTSVGDVQIRVPETPDGRFAGRIVII